MMTLHHVPDISATLRQISELVAPGGLAVLVDGAKLHCGRVGSPHYWACRGLAGDIFHAFEKFWISIDRTWVDHLMSDRFLRPEDFVPTYSHAFPDATVRPVSGLYTVVWQRPDGDEEQGTVRDKQEAKDIA